MEKQVILLNGPSSSGKSTLAACLQRLIQAKRRERYDRLWMIRVSCPPEVLREREAARGNRCPGSAEASAAYLFPKNGYDLTVDTHSMTAADNAGWIYGHCFHKAVLYIHGKSGSASESEHYKALFP